jgi:hypothetical protein
VPVGCLADDVEALLGKECRERVTCERMVIDDQNAN